MLYEWWTSNSTHNVEINVKTKQVGICEFEEWIFHQPGRQVSCVVWAGGGDDMRIGDHHLWLLDIGASGHFTYDASQFRD